MFAMTLTGKTDPYKKGFGPFVPEVYRVPRPTRTGVRRAGTAPAAARGTASVHREGLREHRAPEQRGGDHRRAGLGGGGFLPFPDHYLRRLRELCDEHGIVLIVDEVQTGFGRTGKMFAIEHSGVVPDLLVTAKSLGGGMPIGGVTGKKEIMDAPHVGGLGTTYGGNPLACAAALAVLDSFEQDGILERANVVGERIMGAMHDIQAKHPDFVGDVRGRGPMAAMELVQDAASRTPTKEDRRGRRGRVAGGPAPPDRGPVRQRHPHARPALHHRRGVRRGAWRSWRAPSTRSPSGRSATL
jgi:4-aminobutyrate aminotransferase/(S)-3-amino-2-methylpropionate transaminase